MIGSNKNVVVTAPFRIDVGMGGVSDLDWWGPIRGGHCLSICAEFEGNSIGVSGQLVETSEIELVGFGSTPLVLREVHESLLHTCKREHRLPLATIVALQEWSAKNKQQLPLVGVRLVNESVFTKGMGGSSAIAACISAAIGRLALNTQLPFKETLDIVTRAEALAGIGGGWEDISAAFHGGICRVTQAKLPSLELRIAKLNLPNECAEAIEDSLLVGVSNVPASTEQILSKAKQHFEYNPSFVESIAARIIEECKKTEDAIKEANLVAVGESLTNQRKNWALITNGDSACQFFTEIMRPIENQIFGFKEAGAGGGGTVLVISKPNAISEVKDFLNSKNILTPNWNISISGLNTKVVRC